MTSAVEADAVDEPSVFRGPFSMDHPRRIAEDLSPRPWQRVVVQDGSGLTSLDQGVAPTSRLRWVPIDLPKWLLRSFGPEVNYFIVDLEPRTTKFVVELESAEEGWRFRCGIEVRWKIRDVCRAVAEGPDVATPMLRFSALVGQDLIDGSRAHKMSEAAEFSDWLRAKNFSERLAEGGLFEVIAVNCSVWTDADFADGRRESNIVEMRREKLEAALMQGESGLLIQMLLNNPSSAEKIYVTLREDKQQDLRVRLEMLKAFLASSDTQQHERAEVLDKALRWLPEPSRTGEPGQIEQLPERAPRWESERLTDGALPKSDHSSTAGPPKSADGDSTAE